MDLTEKWLDLEERQKKFALNFLTNGFKKKKAAIDAGYSPASAHISANKCLKSKRVINYIKNYMSELEKDLGITIQWKLGKLKQCVDISLPEEGEQLTVESIKKYSPSDAIKAIDVMNKMQGHYKQNDEGEEEKDLEELNQLVSEHEREY